MTNAPQKTPGSTPDKEANPAGPVNAQSIAADFQEAASPGMQGPLEQGQNPYRFLAGATPVKLAFLGQKKLEDALFSYFSSFPE